MSKYCPKCQKEKPESEFSWKVKNTKLAVHCKECSRKYIREHYYKNKQYYLRKAQKRNRAIKQKCIEFIGKYLKSHSCVDCGENDILVLEFDHKDRKNKDFEINTIIKRRLPLSRLIEEINKCNVRCSNCHRRKTAVENNSWKLKYRHP